jgi:hypothetical protein
MHNVQYGIICLSAAVVLQLIIWAASSYFTSTASQIMGPKRCQKITNFYLHSQISQHVTHDWEIQGGGGGGHKSILH